MSCGSTIICQSYDSAERVPCAAVFYVIIVKSLRRRRVLLQKRKYQSNTLMGVVVAKQDRK